MVGILKPGDISGNIVSIADTGAAHGPDVVTYSLATGKVADSSACDGIDYRALLVKYIRLVVDSEGVDFLMHACEPEFTLDEIAALVTASEEASQ